MELKSLFRSLTRHKMSSLLNLIGLGIAFATTYILSVQVWDNATYNHCLHHAGRAYQLQQLMSSGEYIPLSHGHAHRILSTNSDVEAYGTFLGRGPITLQVNEASTDQYSINERWALPGTGKAIGLRMVEGKMDDLTLPNTFMLDQSTARKMGVHVGDEVWTGIRGYRRLVGIYRDIPRNCDYHGMQMFSYHQPSMQVINNWEETGFVYIVRLKEDATLPHFLRECMYLRSAADQHYQGKEEEMLRNKTLLATPLDQMYYYRNGHLTTLMLFTIIVLTVFMAFFNFFNFFMATLPRRIHNAGIRNIIGCSKGKVRRQFIAETLLLVVLSLGLGILLVACVADQLDTRGLLDTPIRFQDNLPVMATLIAGTLLIAFVVSLYPAYYITHIPALQALQRSYSSSLSARKLRYCLLGLQFAISLIVSTYALFGQLQYRHMLHADLGFDPTHILCGALDQADVQKFSDRQMLANRLKQHPHITDVTFSSTCFDDSNMGWGRSVNGKSVFFRCSPVDINYLQFMGIDVVEGRDFSLQDNDGNGTLIMNQQAKQMYDIQLHDPIYGHNGPADIVGFCENIHYYSLANEEPPMAFYVFGLSSWYAPNLLHLRTTPEADVKELTHYVEQCLLEQGAVSPNFGIRLTPYTQIIRNSYTELNDTNTLLQLFSLSILCLPLIGVLGMVFFESQYRRREVALRRIHGASAHDILRMFVVQYLQILLISSAVAIPITYLAVHRWLQQFANAVDITPWPFIVVLLMNALITSVIVVIQTYHAANENPSHILNRE